jgi:hypothetical protein
MYNLVLGSTSYAEFIIQQLTEKNKLVTVIDKKENLNRISHKIIKIEVNIENVKLVVDSIHSTEFESIYIVSDNDKLNLMLADLLAPLGKTYVLFFDEKLVSIADGNYKIICPNLLAKEFIKREME